MISNWDSLAKLEHCGPNFFLLYFRLGLATREICARFGSDGEAASIPQRMSVESIRCHYSSHTLSLIWLPLFKWSSSQACSSPAMTRSAPLASQSPGPGACAAVK